jgi:Protein of unknown function (DUF3626)
MASATATCPICAKQIAVTDIIQHMNVCEREKPPDFPYSTSNRHTSDHSPSAIGTGTRAANAHAHAARRPDKKAVRKIACEKCGMNIPEPIYPKHSSKCRGKLTTISNTAVIVPVTQPIGSVSTPSVHQNPSEFIMVSPSEQDNRTDSESLVEPIDDSPLIPCIGCCTDIPIPVYETHIESCGGVGTTCPMCFLPFSRKKLPPHVASCDGYEAMMKRRDHQIKCPLCAEWMEENAVDIHIANCSAFDASASSSIDPPSLERQLSTVTCPVCSVSYPTEYIHTHVDRCIRGEPDSHAPSMLDDAKSSARRLGEDDEYKLCPSCSQVIPSDIMHVHIAECFGGYDGKGFSALHEIETHHCKSQSVYRPSAPKGQKVCPSCLRVFGQDIIDNHINACALVQQRAVQEARSQLSRVLNARQFRALIHMSRVSHTLSDGCYHKVLRRMQNLGLTKDAFIQVIRYVRVSAPIVIHVSLKVIRLLNSDTRYRNLFEIRTGNGNTDFDTRAGWEDTIFSRIYQNALPAERVKYGVLNITNDPAGVQTCNWYGECHMIMRNVRLRSTFASCDTSHADVQLATCEFYCHVLDSYTDQELMKIALVATGVETALPSGCLGNYKEIQIHGDVVLARDVEALAVPRHHMKNDVTRQVIEKFCQRNRCDLRSFSSSDTTTPIPAEAGLYPKRAKVKKKKKSRRKKTKR